MNSERAAKLKQMSEDVRIGGKGSARRKRKVVHRTAASDDKKLQASLKKLMMNNIPGIEEVNMIRDDGHVIHFNNPKVQASLAANTFAITGHAETKLVTEILPQIINQLGPDSLRHLYQGGRKDGADINGHPDTIVEDDEDVPELVDNFDAPSKNESRVGDADDDVPPLVEVAQDSQIDDEDDVPPLIEAVPVAAAEPVVEVTAPVAVAETAPIAEDSTPEVDTTAVPVVEATEITPASTVETAPASFDVAAPAPVVVAPALVVDSAPAAQPEDSPSKGSSIDGAVKDSTTDTGDDADDDTEEDDQPE